MADELLSIDTDNLDALANAIKDKAGVSRSTKLAFPSEFVSTLQTIETEATVTPKITPQQKVLTPSDTSFSIDAGFHDGTGTVSIQTETGSANPTSSQQTYYPSTGKFFSSFYVGGTGEGFQIQTGEVTSNGSKDFTINDLPFTPAGFFAVLKTPTGAANSGVIHKYGVTPNFNVPEIYNSKSSDASTGMLQEQTYGSVTTKTGYERFRGTYYYIAWGN